MYSTAGYCAMKNHFNDLYRGAYKRSNGLEMIRNIYKDMFSHKINLYNIVETHINVGDNCVDTIVSLVGPKPDDYIPTGLVRYYKLTGIVNIIPEHYVEDGITKETFKDYLNIVYSSMSNVVRFDNFWLPDAETPDNPFTVYIKSCPFYYTFHHVMECMPNVVVEEELRTLLMKHLVSEDEEADAVLNSISNNKFSCRMEDVYKTMTVNSTIDLFRW